MELQAKFEGEGGQDAPQHTHCRRCRRALKNPRSRMIGIGPVCERRAVADTMAAKEAAKLEGPVFELVVRDGMVVS